MNKKFLYMALLSLLITSFFSACERLLGGVSVTVITGENTSVEKE